MKLTIVSPDKRIVIDKVMKIDAEGKEGRFVLLPKHIDYISVIIPGILSFETDGDRFEAAVDEGILIKRGEEVKAAVKGVIVPEEGENLKTALKRYFSQMDESVKKEREIMAKLEGEIIKNFMMKR